MFLSRLGGDGDRILAALGRQLLVVELALDGTFLSANDNYCDLVGLDRAAIKGKHHSLVVDAAYANSPQYAEFLAKIARGESFSQETKRLDKGGRQRWVRAYYCPVNGPTGALRKVVAVALDIDAAKLEAIEKAAKWDAISRVQAVIEFTVDGTIIAANENFLDIMGYRLEEIQGRHHAMFLDATYAQSAEYQENWRRLTRGEFLAREFKRIGKGGKEVWLEAWYSPIFDLDQRVVKIVEFATDATGRVVASSKIGEGLSRLAEGDLTQRIDSPFVPQFEKLRLDFNESVESLEKVAASIIASAAAVKLGAGEISAASADLSLRTE